MKNTTNRKIDSIINMRTKEEVEEQIEAVESRLDGMTADTYEGAEHQIEALKKKLRQLKSEKEK